MLDTTKEGLLRFIQDLVSQVPNESFPYMNRIKAIVRGGYKGTSVNMDRYLQVLETIANLSQHFGASMLDLLQELFFTGDPLQDSLLTLSRLVLAKSDRTVIDLSDRLQKTKQLP